MLSLADVVVVIYARFYRVSTSAQICGLYFTSIDLFAIIIAGLIATLIETSIIIVFLTNLGDSLVQVLTQRLNVPFPILKVVGCVSQGLTLFPSINTSVQVQGWLILAIER